MTQPEKNPRVVTRNGAIGRDWGIRQEDTALEVDCQ
jgi:hypothetical protein